MEYKIVLQINADLLEMDVNKLIKDGWQPHGGASVCCYYDRRHGQSWLHQQAMVRRWLSHNASVTGSSAPQPETTMKNETTSIDPSELPHLLVDAGPEAFGTMRAELMDARLRLKHYERGEEAMKNRIAALLNALRIGAEALREYAGSCEALDSMELELSCFADDVQPNAVAKPTQGATMTEEHIDAAGPLGSELERPVGRLGPEREYLRTVAELQELASKAPYVTQDWVLQVASMDPADMRRRLIRSSDWHGHFAHSLDGIPEIRTIGGGGIDGCRSHKEVRAIVLDLLRQIERLKTPNARDGGALGDTETPPVAEASSAVSRPCGTL